jgi:hypothetical protein
VGRSGRSRGEDGADRALQPHDPSAPGWTYLQDPRQRRLAECIVRDGVLKNRTYADLVRALLAEYYHISPGHVMGTRGSMDQGRTDELEGAPRYVQPDTDRKPAVLEYYQPGPMRSDPEARQRATQTLAASLFRDWNDPA